MNSAEETKRRLPNPGIASKFAAFLLGVVLAVAAQAPLATAKPGDLDPSFGENGRAATAADLGSSWREAKVHLAIAPGGSTLVASGRQLFRYLPTGHLDRTFGAGGTVTFDEVEGTFFRIADIAIDGEGRIVVFGSTEDLAITTRIPNYGPGGSVHPTFAVVLRLEASGRLDPSFGGGDGIVRTDLGLPHTLEGEDRSRPPLVRGVGGIIDASGRPVLLAAKYEFLPRGFRSLPGWATRLVVRLTPAGDLDPSFGAGAGVAVLASYANRGLEIHPTGEPLIAWGGIPSVTDITRLAIDGAALTDYGAAGTRTIDGGGEAMFDRFGRLVVLASPSESVGRLLRLKTNGSIDRKFGRSGTATVRLPGRHTGLSSLAVDRRGRTLLVGTTMRPRTATIGFDDPQELFVVGRLDASGQLDRSFGHDGWITTGFGRKSKVAGAHSVLTETGWSISGPQAALDEQGRLVVADAGHSPQLQPGGVFLARYLLGR